MKERIAIVGTGISGMAAAYMLHDYYDITVFEKNDYIGGHSRTLTVDYDGVSIPVDTGFIVYNNRNYPLLTKLFAHLGVETIESPMTFAVSTDGGKLEYCVRSLSSLFAQRRNFLRPAFYGMVRDILKFNKQAPELLESDSRESLGDFLSRLKMGEWFIRYYLLPMGGCIWSCSSEQMMEFPAKTFVRFFYNHGLLTVDDQPQWRTVTGGSIEYVKKITAPFKDRVKLKCGVASITRVGDKVQLVDETGQTSKFDRVVLASHGDESLRMLSDADEKERNTLGAFRYQENTAYLHRDVSLMPKRKNCWGSWMYLAESRAMDESPAISLSYWMNYLQSIDEQYPLFVTLNPLSPPAEELTFNKHVFMHPMYDQAMVDAQARLPELQGHRNIWYCGAYHRYGFHEDGLMSAVAVAERLGVEVAWK